MVVGERGGKLDAENRFEINLKAMLLCPNQKKTLPASVKIVFNMPFKHFVYAVVDVLPTPLSGTHVWWMVRCMVSYMVPFVLP